MNWENCYNLVCLVSRFVRETYRTGIICIIFFNMCGKKQDTSINQLNINKHYVIFVDYSELIKM